LNDKEKLAGIDEVQQGRAEPIVASGVAERKATQAPKILACSGGFRPLVSPCRKSAWAVPQRTNICGALSWRSYLFQAAAYFANSSGRVDTVTAAAVARNIMLARSRSSMAMKEK
jgi:hypothetical protein